ncbi:hypothetical protein FB45DRAFT_1018602 [Roridomyces roridus]|uniref:Uncharacterized protein n=1 Tax=Roridomyces roridus TaxID=1738132 RepID=A0AAD7G2Y4_9AGAR|nr:hypothetical protein FB45DRAFT_1018602 [Roridomyces roridus]
MLSNQSLCLPHPNSSVTTVYNAKVTMMNADAAEEPSSPMSAVIEEPSSPMITAAEEPSSTIEATAEEPSSPIETIDREPSLTTAVTVYTDATRSSHHASPFLSDMDQNTGSPLAFRKDDVGKEMMSELVKPLRQYGENVLQRMQMQEQKREPDMESWIEVYHAVGLSMFQQLNHVSEMSSENVQELSDEMLQLQRILSMSFAKARPPPEPPPEPPPMPRFVNPFKSTDRSRTKKLSRRADLHPSSVGKSSRKQPWYRSLFRSPRVD